MSRLRIIAKEGCELNRGLYIKPMWDNECWLCSDSTTPEGYMCRKHWRDIPGHIKEQCQWSRKQALLYAKAAEELRRNE